MSESIAAVERAGEILHAFIEASPTKPTLGVTELAERLALSKAVVHRTLISLKASDLVHDDGDGRYTLGPAVLALGTSYLRNLDIRDMSRHLLRRLCDETNETATLSVRRGATRVYVDQVNPIRDIKMTVEIGSSAPLHAGASSKALLAHLEEEEVDSILSGVLHKLTKRTIVEPKEMRRELALVREQGFAVSLGERQEGGGSVASPILNDEGRPLGVIAVCAPTARIKAEMDAIAPLLVEGVRLLSKKFGWRDDASI